MHVCISEWPIGLPCNMGILIDARISYILPSPFLSHPCSKQISTLYDSKVIVLSMMEDVSTIYMWRDIKDSLNERDSKTGLLKICIGEMLMWITMNHVYQDS